MKLDTRLRELVEEFQRNNRRPDGTKPSQAEIAVNAGVNPSTLSRYMDGKTESYNREVMEKLAKYLGVKNVNELFVLKMEDGD
jgi:transcriptional regulator with XRE-family HTH domain